MKHALSIWLCLTAALGTSHALAAGDSSAGKQKAETCAGCHGQDGNSSVPVFPKLAGQKASYIAKQLYDFKTERRPEPTMTALAEPMNDADIADLSAYFAAQKVKVEKGKENEAGKNLFHAGNPATGLPACTGCHGPEGKGNEPAAFPVLHGQHAPYLTKTLHDFRGKSRYNDRNEVMRSIAAKLSDEEINAVAEYLAGLE